MAIRSRRRSLPRPRRGRVPRSRTAPSPLPARSTPSLRHHATSCPLRIVPCCTRQSARRPTYGDAVEVGHERLQRMSLLYAGAGMCVDDQVEQRLQVRPERIRVGLERRLPCPRIAVDDGELDLALVGAEVEEQRRRPGPAPPPMRASGRSTLLTTRIDGRAEPRAPCAGRSASAAAAPRSTSTSSSTPSTIVSPRSTSPPKSACPGVSTMLIFTSPWRTAVFLARIVMPFSRSSSPAVEHALGDVLVRAKRPRLPEHRVDEGRLAMVDVGDDGDIADGRAARHPPRVPAPSPWPGSAGPSVARSRSPVRPSPHGRLAPPTTPGVDSPRATCRDGPRPPPPNAVRRRPLTWGAAHGRRRRGCTSTTRRTASPTRRSPCCASSPANRASRAHRGDVPGRAHQRDRGSARAPRRPAHAAEPLAARRRRRRRGGGARRARPDGGVQRPRALRATGRVTPAGRFATWSTSASAAPTSGR